MEKAPTRTEQTTESIESEPLPTTPEAEVPTVVEEASAAPEKTDEEQEQIQCIKDRLLENGGVVIEDLEGDPFTLLKGHESTGAEVTIYSADGSVRTMTFEERRAELKREIAAAQFFERAQKGRSSKLFNPVQLIKRGFSWVKGLFGKLFSRLSKQS